MKLLVPAMTVIAVIAFGAVVVYGHNRERLVPDNLQAFVGNPDHLESMMPSRFLGRQVTDEEVAAAARAFELEIADAKVRNAQRHLAPNKWRPRMPANDVPQRSQITSSDQDRGVFQRSRSFRTMRRPTGIYVTSTDARLRRSSNRRRNRAVNRFRR